MPDPAYTQCDPSSKNWQIGTDATWVDYDLYTNMGVPKGAVAEIIMANVNSAAETVAGIRTDSSSLERKLTLHEAEPLTDYDTHCRMFVLCDASTGYVECYAGTATDIEFYLVGYWENVGFTERFDSISLDTSESWVERTLAAGSGLIHHLLLANKTTSASYILGAREKGSSLERKVQGHEAEAGGESIIDILVTADTSAKVELYSGYFALASFYDVGYFGSELEFIERWQEFGLGSYTSWEQRDLSAYLDEDGRLVDVMCLNSASNQSTLMGVRDGDDTTTERKLPEHEAEGTTTEYTGFSMSGKTNSSGIIRIYRTNDLTYYYLTGYFKPAAGGAVVKLAAETVSLVEALIRRAWSIYPVNNTITLIGATVRKGTLNPQLTDETEVSTEGVVRRGYGAYLVNSTINLIEGLLRRAWSNYFVSSTASLVEGLMRKGTLDPRVADATVSLTEAFVRIAGFVRVATAEVVSLTETFVKVTFSTIVEIANETISLAGSLLRRAFATRFTPDTETITPAFLRRLRGIYLIADTVGVLEALIRRLWTTYLSAETVVVSEVKIRRAWFAKVAAEGLGILGAAIVKTAGWVPDVLATLVVKLQRRFR